MTAAAKAGRDAATLEASAASIRYKRIALIPASNADDYRIGDEVVVRDPAISDRFGQILRGRVVGRASNGIEVAI